MDGEEIKAAILFYFIFVRKLTMSRRRETIARRNLMLKGSF